MTKQSDSFPSSDFWKQCARPCAGAGLNRLRAIWKGAEQVMQVIHPEKASRGPAPAQGRSPQARPSASRHHTLLAPPPLCAGAWPAAAPSSGHSTHRARDCCSRATRRSLASPAAAQPAHTLVACCSVQKHVRPHAALQSSSHFHRQPVTSSLLLVYTVRLLQRRPLSVSQRQSNLVQQVYLRILQGLGTQQGLLNCAGQHLQFSLAPDWSHS